MFLGTPHVPQTLCPPCFFHVFYYWKNINFYLLLGVPKVRPGPRNSIFLTLVFWLFLSVLFQMGIEKHQFMLVYTVFHWGHCFWLVGCVSCFFRLFEPCCFHPLRSPFLRILTASDQHQIDPGPVKIELSSRRNACFQIISFFFQDSAAQTKHKKTSQNGSPKSIKIGPFCVVPIGGIWFFLEKYRILTSAALGDPFGPPRGPPGADLGTKMTKKLVSKPVTSRKHVF